MRASIWFVAALTLCVAESRRAAIAAESAEERQLVQTLQETSSPEEKNEVCARLKRIGSSYCVPALAALLLDEQLSHSARYALESLPSPEAGTALVNALGKTSGLTRIGIINSLGTRGEASAVPQLTKLLADSQVDTAVASAVALGQIGGADAISALRAQEKGRPGPLHAAVADGLLRCANRLLALGNPAEAQSIFSDLYNSETLDAVRIAAYRGWIRASGEKGLELMTKAIIGPPGPGQVAALQLVNEIQIQGTTTALAELASKTAPPVQIALVAGLGQRGDPAAVQALLTLAPHAPRPTQPAIIEALGSLGDPDVVPVLATFAASAPPEVQTAARNALAELHRGKVTEMLLSQLATATPEVQAEVARALGTRGDRSAVPKLLDLAQQGPVPTRGPALRALGLLVDESQLRDLVACVLKAADDPSRVAAAEAVNAAYQRLHATRGQVDAGPLAEGLKTGSAGARIAMLPVCSGLADPRIREALRAGLQDSDPKVSAAATRALCDTTDLELMDDLMKVARQTPENNFRTLALAGCVRLLGQEEGVKLPPAQRAAVLGTLMTMATRPDQKRLVLAGLAEVPDPGALSVVEAALGNPDVRNEAARAATKIAPAVAATDSKQARAVLRQALATASDGATRQAVAEALKQVEATASYLTQWQISGPYRQEGKDYAALFDVVFPPETNAASGGDWKPLPAGNDPQRPYVMDLLKALGGEQRVAYVRTWVQSDQKQPALLQLGSDDGVKIWLNGEQVFALNTARPLQPGSDKVPLTLRAGSNLLLMKITQNNLGWEFTTQLLKPDGSPLDGVQSGTKPGNGTSAAK